MKEKNIVYPYIPNSVEKTKREMMEDLGIEDINELFSVIPNHLKMEKQLELPNPLMDEYSIRKHTEDLLSKNINANDYTCFLGAGCAPHYVPSIVDEIITRGEFATAFSGSSMSNHGLHQSLFEYQSLMGDLLEMDFVGTPVFDSTLAMGHALRIAVKKTGRKKVLMPKSMNPEALLSVENYLSGIIENYAEIVLIDIDPNTGLIDLLDLREKLSEDVAAVLIENPNFLGLVELHAEEIGDLSRANGSELIVSCDPISLGVVEPPVNYGATIVVGDLHSLGLHMSAGSGVAGFISMKDEVDYLGNYKDFVYSICETNKKGEYGFYAANYLNSSYGSRDKGNDFTGTGAALHGIAAGVYLSLLGPKGIEEIGETIMKKLQYAHERFSEIPSVKVKFNGPSFKELVLNFDEAKKTVAEINKELLGYKIFGGLDLTSSYPELGESMLVCIVETHSKKEIDSFVMVLKKIIM